MQNENIDIYIYKKKVYLHELAHYDTREST